MVLVERMSADQPGALAAEVLGPTRTIVKAPVTELKLLPGAVAVSVRAR
ncbi:MAG: hypothetical protein WDO13_19260 [Verrucomicrobiota bacterium]